MTAAARTLLLATGAACAAIAGALLWPQAGRSAADFTPPAEDICIVPPVRAIAAIPHDPASGLGIHDARPVPPAARCPVCGMYPARFPAWAAQLIFADGAAHFFDSAVDLFLFLADPATFDAGRRREDVAALYVTDFASRGWVDARRAHFVAGSDARGPMRGADLPAFASTAAAAAFAAERGGRVIGFDAVDADLLTSLRGANHVH